MARLNEAPAPTESLDALKRRFIRQNREIARTNSAQALRIRNLEAEFSRLLAENIALREQAINLKQELEKQEAGNKIANDVLELKSELEEKLLEVNSLVSKLNDVANPPRKQQPRRSLLGEPARSPQQREWRNSQTLGQILAAQEGRLPRISEEFGSLDSPRKSRSGEEFGRTGLNTDISESPDLGPPPITHFEVSDPIKFDRSPAPSKFSEDDDNEAMSMVDLSSNLDRRRKRRASTLLEEILAENKHSSTESQPQEPNPSESFGKTARAKVNRRNNELRSVKSQIEQENLILDEKMKAKDKIVEEIPIDMNIQSKRKPLGAKSTNSPNKPRRLSSIDKSVTEDTVVQVEKPSRRSRPVSFLDISLQLPKEIQSEDVIQQSASLAPKTPAPSEIDLFSPGSSDVPSTGKQSAMQLSEMASTTASLEDVVGNATGRGSRRARPAVSYAEPKLNVKMRRPGKELVDAVAAERQSQGMKNDSSSEVDDRALSTIRTITIKGEKPEALTTNWKDLRCAEPPAAQDQQSDNVPGSPLIGKASRAKSKAMSFEDLLVPKGIVDDLATESMSKLSIFDVPSSSPHTSQEVELEDPSTIAATSKPSKATTGHRKSVAPSTSSTDLTRKPSRRHSSAVGRAPSASTATTRPSSSASLRGETSAASSSASNATISTSTSKPKPHPRRNSTLSSSTTTTNPALSSSRISSVTTSNLNSASRKRAYDDTIRASSASTSTPAAPSPTLENESPVHSYDGGEVSLATTTGGGGKGLGSRRRSMMI